MTGKSKLMFYCQHVLGMGHFIRSMEIVRGLADFDIYFLNGGEIVPGFDPPPSIEIINLPPIKSDAEFSGLHAADAAQSLDEIKAIRKRLILSEYERIKPDVVVIELFPFGRKKFDFELMPLLERCRADNRVKVACSLRDILVSKRDQRKFEERVCRTANQYFDLLLIHSDKRFQRLEESFSMAGELECQVCYTGFVAQTAAETGPAKNDEWTIAGDEKRILVSIGGGRVGSELIECAIETSRLLKERLPHQMLAFAGPYMPDDEFQRLQGKLAAESRFELRRYTTEFASYLSRADLSISMAGYNTCMNIIAAGARAVVYPFTGNGNDEQTLRAMKLNKLGLVNVIHADELNPANLAEKIFMTIGKPKPSPAQLDLNGVRKTAEALKALVDKDNG
ncbi:MAG: glycosyltransferase family protein [Blastocatellales bacterium]